MDTGTLAETAPANSDDTLDLAGTWHLAECRTAYPGRKSRPTWGSSASGYLIYAPDGYMCQNLTYPGSDGAVRTVSFCGSYEVIDGTVVHRIAGGADVRDVGTVRTAAAALDSGILTLTYSPAPGGGPGSSREYVWRRARPIPGAGRSARGSIHRAQVR